MSLLTRFPLSLFGSSAFGSRRSNSASYATCRPTIGSRVKILDTDNTRKHFPAGIGKEFVISADVKDEEPYQISGYKIWLAESDVQLSEADDAGSGHGDHSPSKASSSSSQKGSQFYANVDANGEVVAPSLLHAAFDHSKVQPYEEDRFETVAKLSDAKRNRGVVHLMRDKKTKRDLAVKQMPNWWIRSSHSGFVAEHPGETELPWQDIGCTYFLNSVGYLPACDLHGVYRDATHTYVMQSLATEGDLFNWCQEADQQPGPDREHVVADLAVQILAGVKMLHDMSITHRDLSLENILLTKPRQSANGCSNSRYEIRIIDFSMASSTRTFQKSVRGKASYQAPELHTDEKYDAFLADCFAVGVTLYCMLMMDYPWLSTKPGGCKCFEYVETHGFRAYIAKRKIRAGSDRVGDRMSEPVKSLIEGMLCFDPSKRLTLGEKQWPDNSPRRSVWDEEWVKDFLLTEEFPQVMAGTVVV